MPVPKVVLFLVGCVLLVLAAANLSNLGEWSDRWGGIPVFLVFFLVMSIAGRWFWAGADAILVAAVKMSATLLNLIQSAGAAGKPVTIDTEPRRIPEHPARDGKAYCCAVIDCFSRQIVGRALSTIADTALVNNAVNMAVRERSPSGATIVHADHGTQFTSWSWGENLRQSGLTPSFGSVGDCFENAAIEAFWGRMHVELLNTKKWATTFELVVAMAIWIDTIYNPQRVHSYVGNISPDQYETLWASSEPFQLQ